MLSKILILIVILLMTGVALTLSLPEYKTDSPLRKNDVAYTIIQDSLTSPYLMNDLLLISPSPPDAEFALRLGLYHQLQQAITVAKTLQIPTKPYIIKAIDTHREWYIILLGPYASKSQAEQKKLWLQKNQLSATLSMWPTTHSNE